MAKTGCLREEYSFWSFIYSTLYIVFADCSYVPVILKEKTMKSLILFFFLLVAMKGNSMSAEPVPAEVSGKVTDSQSKQPIEYASVAVYKSNDSSLVFGTITGPGGDFLLTGLKSGKYYIEIRFIGYRTSVIEKNVGGGNLHLGTIELEPELQMLTEAEVAAEKNVIQYQIDRQVINPANMLNASAGSAIDVIRQSASVTTDSEENVMLRGSGDYMLLLDGKPVTANRTEILRQIPASQVAKVEVLTNPSAKYDAAGASGIIHVYTIRSEEQISGMLNIREGNGNKNNIDGIFRKKTGNLTWQLAANYNLNQHPSSSTNEWKSVVADSIFYLQSQVKRNMLRTNIGVRPEIEMQLSPSTRMAINGSYSRFGFDRNIEVFYHNVQMGVSDYSRSSDRFFLGADMYQTGFFFRHDFDSADHKLEITCNYLVWKGINDQNIEQFHSDAEQSLGEKQFDQTFYEDHLMNDVWLAVDYQRRLSGGVQTESGIRSSYRGFEADKEFRSYNAATGKWSLIPLYSGRHNLHEEMQSGYYAASKTFGKYSVKAGMRLQYYTRFTDIPEQATVIDFRQFYAFPSLHINSKGEEGRQWQLSYSRRIQLPDDWSTSPVPIFSDGFLVQAGNPALKPQLFDVAEINHIRYIKETMISMSVFGRSTGNAVERILSRNEEGLFVVMPENVAHKYYVGSEAGSQIKILSWLTASVNASGYLLSSSVNTADTSFSYSQFSYTARASLQFKAGSKTRFECAGNYVGPEKEMQGTREAMFGIDLSARRSFLDKKLNLTITFNNVFNSNSFKVRSQYDMYTTVITFKQEYPVIFVSLSYRINDFKPIQRRQQEAGPAVPAV